MKKCYAQVIVDIEAEELDRPFTYRIPEEMREDCVPGCSVRIPFGRNNREIQGYVIGLSDESTLPEEKIKNLLAVTAGGETAEGRLVQLAAWMSRRYGSTMIRAMKTVLPLRKKVGAVTERTVSLTDPAGAASLAETFEKKHFVAKARIVRALESGPKDMRALEKEAHVSASVIRALAGEGIVKISVSEILRRVTEEAEMCPPDVLTDSQAEVCEAIRREWGDSCESRGRALRRPVLLQGITGSGKTVVYTELIADALERGEQAIVLIPEIALTWQTVLRFVRRFGDRVSFLHSRLSGGERYDQMKAARSGDVSVMVGPRSALFTPFPKLGLIVIDEEHEESYHSELMPRYYAAEVAVKRGEIEGARVLFGSATPSVRSAYQVKTGDFLGVSLSSRFGGRSLPQTSIADMRSEMKNGNRSILSDILREKMESHLAGGGQVMLFLNRRGYAGAVTCRSCGYVVKCPHCDVSLTRHSNGMLICHYCGYETPELKSCPECGSKHISGITVGTQQVEEIVGKAFPAARILRMDLDTTRGKEGHSRILKSFADGEADILIGTQMIVKGHDFPRVTLVGVLLADLSLNESDYRSGERTYQLIAQAVGRAGRGERPGEAVIQTYSPEHYAVTAGAAQDYEAFFREEIAFRKLMQYPPAGGLLAIMGSSPDEELLDTGMQYIRRYIGRIDPEGKLMAIGPAPESVGKVRDQYRKVIYVRNTRKEQLIRAKDMIEEYIALNRGFDEIHIMFDFQ